MADPKNRVIIADIFSNNCDGVCVGHFFTVADNYCSVLDGANVTVAGGPVYRIHYKDGSFMELPCDYINHETNKLSKLVSGLRNSLYLFRKAKNGETIILQQGSDAAALIGIALFFHRKAKLFMIQYSNEPLNGRVKRFIYNRFVKNKIEGIVCPSKLVGETFGRPYVIVPDYIYVDRNESSEASGTEKIYDFCCVGRLTEQKGILAIMKAFAGTPYKLLVAGFTQDQEYIAQLKEAAAGEENITLNIEYLTDEKYHSCIKASRYGILNYTAEYSRRSSGVVFDFIFDGVPVFCSDTESFSMVKEYKLGYLYAVLGKESISQAMEGSAYEKYLQGIDQYRMSHRRYADELSSFILGKR